MKPPAWNLEAERDLWRAICAPNAWHVDGVKTHPRSLYWFLQVAWGAKFFLKSHPEQPQWLYEPIHGPYMLWLQKHLLAWKKHALSGRPGRYHIASVLPRGYGKTVSATKAGSLWSHLDEPDMTTLLCSATADFSRDILEAIASVLSGSGSGSDSDSWFTWLYGNWKQGARNWKPREYLVSGYRKAGNISESTYDISATDIGMTGYHHRQHWWDDPLSANKIREGRDAYLRSAHTAVNASYNALLTNGLMALTLTRYLDADIAGTHFREEGIATWEGMPCPHMALFDKVEFGSGIWHVFFYQTEDELTGEPTHPILWTKQAIKEAKSRDAEDFSCQQQNNPGSGERAPLLESQLPYLYMTYQDFYWDRQIEWATIHIDTAFKKKENIRTGDDSAIIVWLKDATQTGILYLDTDLCRASNEWREEDFNKELIKICLSLRKRGIFIRAITDETEPGGKSGTYKNRLLGILRSSGFQMGEDQFIQLNRTTNKRARIRTATGHWAEGYVRILLHKIGDAWHLNPTIRKLFSQILRIDVVSHDDLADAATDGFIPALWNPPSSNPGMPTDEGTTPIRPWDEDLKHVGRPISEEELRQLDLDRMELEESGYMNSTNDWFSDTLPREPI